MLKTLFTVAVAVALLGGPGVVFAGDVTPVGATMASPQAAIDVVVIHATKDGDVDPALAGLRHTLQRAFQGYAGFKKLDEKSSTLGENDTQKLTLANGSELVYRFLGTDADGFLQVHIEVGGLRSTVRVKDGGTFFQAGRGYKDGMIVLAFRAGLAR